MPSIQSFNTTEHWSITWERWILSCRIKQISELFWKTARAILRETPPTTSGKTQCRSCTHARIRACIATDEYDWSFRKTGHLSVQQPVFIYRGLLEYGKSLVFIMLLSSLHKVMHLNRWNNHSNILSYFQATKNLFMYRLLNVYAFKPFNS